ncbi:hypothetical protein ACSQ67_024533 [Phaseolus vulgaris]
MNCFSISESLVVMKYIIGRCLTPDNALNFKRGWQPSTVLCYESECLHCRYLVPADLTIGQLVYVIRKRIKLSAEKAIFIFVDNVLPPTGAIMSAIYNEKKDEDGFLYVTYSGENTFGDFNSIEQPLQINSI